jgi:hypothetical protein
LAVNVAASARCFDDSADFVVPGIKDEPRLAAFDLRRARADLQNTLDQTGVFCLSARADHLKLWSLYAADGAALCIELESDHITDPEYGPFRVTYSDRPKPPWEYGATQEKRKKLATAALLQKSTSWKYQDEWRCIRIWPRNARPTADRYYPIAARALVGVIFGWKLSDDERQRVVSWIDGCYWSRNISLRQATVSGGKVRISKYLPS